LNVKEFNQPPQNYKPIEDVVNPYDRAKEEWDNRIGSARVQAYNWRLFALFAIIGWIITTIGLIYQSSKSIVTPYVVEVNSDGTVKAIGPAKEANYVPSEAQIKYFISQIVLKARSIPLDPVVAKQNWLNVYAFLRQGAAQKMNALLQQDNPMMKIGKQTIQVEVNVIVQMTKDTYQVRWKESVFGAEGALQEQYLMTGLFTIDFTPPKTEKDLLINPLGLYIKDFSWSKEL
jgi:type IV secretory pathway TrbF-like protein